MHYNSSKRFLNSSQFYGFLLSRKPFLYFCGSSGRERRFVALLSHAAYVPWPTPPTAARWARHAAGKDANACACMRMHVQPGSMRLMGAAAPIQISRVPASPPKLEGARETVHNCTAISLRRCSCCFCCCPCRCSHADVAAAAAASVTAASRSAAAAAPLLLLRCSR